MAAGDRHIASLCYVPRSMRSDGHRQWCLAAARRDRCVACAVWPAKGELTRTGNCLSSIRGTGTLPSCDPRHVQEWAQRLGVLASCRDLTYRVTRMPAAALHAHLLLYHHVDACVCFVGETHPQTGQTGFLFCCYLELQSGFFGCCVQRASPACWEWVRVRGREG
jgi:hypothetical protein